MREVTDPALLKLLNAPSDGNRNKTEISSSIGSEVTDPALLEKLNAPDEGTPSPELSDHDNVVRYGLKDPLIGLLNSGSRASAFINNPLREFINKLGGKLPKQEITDFSEMFGIPREQQNAGDKLSQFGGGLIPALFAPEMEVPFISNALMKLPAWGKYLKSALGNSLTQGAIAASQSPNDPGTAALEAGGIAAPFSALALARESGSPTLRNISKVLSALGAGGLAYAGTKSVGAPESISDLSAVLGAALGSRGGNIPRRVREDMLKGVEGTDYQDVVNAGKRIGVHVRPSEASFNPFVASKEGGIGKSPKGAQIFHEEGQKRLGQEETSIDNLFGNIFPKSLEEQKNKLYESANDVKIPLSVMGEFKDNDIIKQALRHVRGDPVYQQELKGVPEDSIKYMNQVKRRLDAMRFGEKDSTKAGIIKDTTNKMLEILDTISTDYKEGRQLAERGIVRREIEDLFNKKDETGSNLFKTVLSNKRDYNNLQDKFKRLEETASTPEQVESMKTAHQQLEDMKLVFGRLIETPTAKNAAALERGNASKGGSLKGIAKDFLKKLLQSDKYDVAAVKLITNPKWSDEVGKLSEITDKDKLMGAFYKLIGKVGAQAIAQ